MKRLLGLAALALVASAWGAPAHASSSPAGSIAELIDKAQPGATIDVPAGTYHEQLVINKTVTLIGHGWPVIDGGGKGDVVRVNAPGVTIRGFIVQGSASEVSDEPAGIRVAADNSRIEGNRVRDVLYGIELQDSNGHTVRDNTVTSMPRFGSERRGHGIYLWHTTNNLVEHNTVDQVKDGFFVGFTSQTIIENNTVTRSRYGIHYMYSNDNTFNKNSFHNNIAGGVLMYSEDITFTGNEFAYNRSKASGYGLLFKDVDNVLVKGNFIHHNRLGMTMEGAPHSPGAFVTLDGNLIAYNQSAIELTSTTQVAFTNNSFMGNLEQVVPRGGNIKNNNLWSVDGRGNYWDEYQGYDANGDGVGDIPFQYDGGYDALVQQNQALRAFAYTPARTALDLAGSWFPSFKPEPRLTDDHPLISPTIKLSRSTGWESRAATIAVALAMAAIPLAGARVVSRRFGRWATC